MTSRHFASLAAFFCVLLLVGPLTAQIVSGGSSRVADFRAVRPTARITRAIDDVVTVTLTGNRHPLARAEFDAGVAAAGTRMDRMILLLQPDQTQQDALEALLAAQQDPQSPEYRSWLTPEDFGQRFGVADSDVAQLAAWLSAQGFQVEPAPASRRQIVFSGTAGQVQAAFHTEIHTYNVSGQLHFANAQEPGIPAAFAEVVAGVVSLHDFQLQPMHQRVDVTVSPEFNSGGSHYLAPADFATIYDSAGLYSQSIDGTGQSIAVMGRSNLKLADVQTFRTQFGLAANNPVVVLNGADPGVLTTGEQTEATLDVEWSGATAPKASIQFVVSASTNTSDGITLSSQYAVNHNLASVLTLSFGSCEAALGASGNQFWNNLWQQAAAQGMTVLVSSGDSGAAGCDDPSSNTATAGASVNGLCSSPYSTCVGGTQFSDAGNPSAYWAVSNGSTLGSALTYIPEAVWNQSGAIAGGSELWAASSGVSTVYPKPAWQTGPGVPADGHRDVPDVALNASTHDGYLIAMNGQLYVVGGTSAPTPSLAGLMALTAQKAGTRLGNANPALYALAALQANAGAAVFHDVTTGNNSVPGQTGFNASPGYDLATGLGSVDATLMVNHWGDVTTPTPSIQLSAGPPSVSFAPGLSASVTLNVSIGGGFNSAVLLSTGALPSGLTASFTPTSLAAPGSGSSTLKLSSLASIAPGTYNLSITATGGGLTQSVPLAVTILQNCTYTLNPTSANAGASGGSFSFTVATQAGCSWSPATTTSWIALSSGSGNGNGRVSYTVAANNSLSARNGSITVGGASVTISEAAATAVFSLNPTSAGFPSSGGNGNVAISVSPSSASWTAVSNASWISINSARSGSGSGTLNYSVASNSTGAARSGTMTIAGSTFTVNQAGPASCSYQIALGPVTAVRQGFIGTVQVSTSPGCQWTAASNASWLAIAYGASGSGNGIVGYTAASNTSPSSRTGSLSVAGYTINLTESGTSSKPSVKLGEVGRTAR
jgi:Pro-kumamolisin, activation domain/Putative binding domain, N-terminal